MERIDELVKLHCTYFEWYNDNRFTYHLELSPCLGSRVWTATLFIQPASSLSALSGATVRRSKNFRQIFHPNFGKSWSTETKKSVKRTTGRASSLECSPAAKSRPWRSWPTHCSRKQLSRRFKRSAVDLFVNNQYDARCCRVDVWAWVGSPI